MLGAGGGTGHTGLGTLESSLYIERAHTYVAFILNFLSCLNKEISSLNHQKVKVLTFLSSAGL